MAKSRTGLQIYQDRGKAWRWRAVARNGKVIADGAEGYRCRAGAVNGARAARRALGAALAGLT